MNTVTASDLSRSRVVRGFTLTELIVAVGAVALLTLGIGQIFSSVGRLVGSGAAIAETDQFARAIGSQMRKDFDGFAQLRPDETFMAIRCRRVGDLNGDGSATGSERAVYLTPEDRQADIRDGILPYAAGSRAITTRLDDIVFLAFSGGDNSYSTAQRVTNSTTPATQVARIHYGHSLRPAPDRVFFYDPNFAGRNTSNTPRRLWFADGDFGSRPSDNNRFNTGGLEPTLQGKSTGRNEYAGQWLFSRHALLLYGGLAAGYGGAPGAPFDTNLTYAPYIRGLESERRTIFGFSNPLADSPDRATPRPTSLINSETGNPLWPFPRLSRHGRTDICAQSPSEVRRWLEGLGPIPGPLGAPTALNQLPDASAFEDGRLDDPLVPDNRWSPADGTTFTKIDAPLYQREYNSANPVVGLSNNHRRVMSAIAGCFERVLAESVPPQVDRGDYLIEYSGAAPIASGGDPASRAMMDLHAVIGSRVSRVEIAWSDGSTWLYEDPLLDPDSAGPLPPRAERSDELWYDIDFARFNDPDSSNDLAGHDPRGLYATSSDNPVLSPEIHAGRRSDVLFVSDTASGAYSYDKTSGAPEGSDDEEYLAIFPFRVADSLGGFTSTPFRKPSRVRIRITIHDSQFRIPGGRQYEFQFSLNGRS